MTDSRLMEARDPEKNMHGVHLEQCLHSMRIVRNSTVWIQFNCAAAYQLLVLARPCSRSRVTDTTVAA